MKKQIRLTENELNSLIKKTLTNVINESKKYEYNPNNETHFAVNKKTNLIVNGWDYSDIDPDELRQFKKDYFFYDLEDNNFNPREYKILTRKTLVRMGLDPAVNTNWSNDGITPLGGNVNESIIKEACIDSIIVPKKELYEELTGLFSKNISKGIINILGGDNIEVSGITDKSGKYKYVFTKCGDFYDLLDLIESEYGVSQERAFLMVNELEEYTKIAIKIVLNNQLSLYGSNVNESLSFDDYDIDDNGYEESQRYLYEDIADDIKSILNACGFDLNEVGECNLPQYYYSIEYNVIPNRNNADLRNFDKAVAQSQENDSLMCDIMKGKNGQYICGYSDIDNIIIEFSPNGNNSYTMYMSQE